MYMGFGIPFGILVMRGFFRRIPRDVVEAAMIDGCSWFAIYARIMMPLALPAVASLLILDGIATWNEFILAQIFLHSEDVRTLPLGLVHFSSEYAIQYDQIAAAVLIGITPIMIVYMFFQRYFVQGLAGAVKRAAPNPGPTPTPPPPPRSAPSPPRCASSRSTPSRRRSWPCRRRFLGRRHSHHALFQRPQGRPGAAGLAGARPPDPQQGALLGGALFGAGKGGVHPPRAARRLMAPLSALSGHPNRRKVPGVEANTGALGHGLPIGVGSAIAARLAGAAWRTFVVLGDGELQEGSNWEAAMAAAHRGLDGLTAVVDRNELQQGARTEATCRLEPLADKWRSFGWEVREVDGHDHAALHDALVAGHRGRPLCVIARTRKGKGVSFMEDRVEWHRKVPSPEQLAEALRELARP